MKKYFTLQLIESFFPAVFSIINWLEAGDSEFLTLNIAVEYIIVSPKNSENSSLLYNTWKENNELLPASLMACHQNIY